MNEVASPDRKSSPESIREKLYWFETRRAPWPGYDRDLSLTSGIANPKLRREETSRSVTGFEVILPGCLLHTREHAKSLGGLAGPSGTGSLGPIGVAALVSSTRFPRTRRREIQKTTYYARVIPQSRRPQLHYGSDVQLAFPLSFESKHQHVTPRAFLIRDGGWRCRKTR